MYRKDNENSVQAKLKFRRVKGLTKYGSLPMIIGYQDMLKHNLTTIFQEIFTSPLNQEQNMAQSEIGNEMSETQMAENFEMDFARQRDQNASNSERNHKVVKGRTSGNDSQPPPAKILPTRRSGRLRDRVDHLFTAEEVEDIPVSYLTRKEEHLDVEEDDDELDDFVAYTPYENMLNEELRDIENIDDDVDNILKQIPDTECRLMAEEVLRKHKTVFRDQLPALPAKLEPFKLELKEGTDWYTQPRNKQAPRLQTLAKQYEVNKFLEKAIANNIIRPSQATAWSQLLLTPKSNGKWRVCMDFRSLNQQTKSMGWPIPNIKDMINKIGSKKAKWFAVLDLTSGYHQAPINEESKHLTAFRTATGLWEWNRLPMGLQGAGSYFQHNVQHVVLKDMLGKIVEIYIDDAIIFAQTKKELMTRLDAVLTRFKKYNIFINPEKAKIGLNKVEYLGHVIDETGIAIDDKKTEKVLDFRLPETNKDMRSFLGLTSQFRDHVKGYANMAKPLHEAISDNKKNSKSPINWTPELEAQFKLLQNKVADCPKLFFLDETSPVVLQTDASNYGMGAYLYQLVDGVKHPIRFISRGFNKVELKWNIVEKEAFAIFYSLMKLEHLIRDRHFILKTDNKNLTYLNACHREKVKRWKLAIQHYDFDVFHIPGVENIEADGFSRLVPFPKQDDVTALENALENPENILQQLGTEDFEQKPLAQMDQRKYEKIKAVHGDKFGHGGIQRTMNLLCQKRQTWRGMRKDVRNFIERCPCCQKLNRVKIRNNINPFTLASTNVMERVAIDTIGPIESEEKANKSSRNKYIVVIIDSFTRYTKLYPVPSTKAEDALHPILDWISQFGCPSEIVSDNGTQYVNKLIEQFTQAAGIEHATIHAYSHEENAIVERANKEVNRHLRAMTYDRKIREDWELYLPLAQRILNTMTHTSIGVSPSQMLYGGIINHDTHFLNPYIKSEPKSHKEHITKLLAAQKHFLNVAVNAQQKLDEFNVSKRETNEPTFFPINSYVLAEYETQVPSKLHTPLHGPYRVVARVGDVYTIENLLTYKWEDYHVKLLREFKYDNVNVIPTEVAKQDKQLFDIQSIVTHRFKGNKKTLTNIQLYMKFEDELEPQWREWDATFGGHEKVHEYLRESGMASLIPIKYTYAKKRQLHENDRANKGPRAKTQKRMEVLVE